jgi:hypothetical protein
MTSSGSISRPDRLATPGMGVSWAPIGVSKMSDREGVRSLEMISVRRPVEAKCRAVVAEVVVLPTPPLPPNINTRLGFLLRLESDIILPVPSSRDGGGRR